MEKWELDILRRFFPVTTGLQTVHTLLRFPDTVGFCDDWERPRMAAVTRGDDLVLAGEADAHRWTTFVSTLNFSGFVQAPEIFLQALKSIDPQLIVWSRVSFVLDGALKDIPCPPNVKIRKVHRNHAAALERIGQSWLWKYWSNAEDFCQTGTAYVAQVDGEAVSMASVFTESDHYADLAVATHPAFRGKGLATAAAHALCKEILAEGRLPVWNTSPENPSSCAIPRRLGFREIPAQPLYVMNRDIPPVT